MIIPYGASVITLNPYLILLIGICIGLLGSYFGYKAMHFTVPVLNIFGLPMTMSIGTDLCHTCSKSLFDAHRLDFIKFINWRLSAILSLSSVLGLYLSHRLLMHLQYYEASDIFCKVLYLFLLSVAAIILIFKHNFLYSELKLLPKCSTFKLFPIVELNPVIRVSLWLPVIIGTVGGLLTGFLGSGSLLFRTPMIAYFLGLPFTIAAATDFIAVLLTSFIGIELWSASGQLPIYLTALLLFSIIIGSQIGYFAKKIISFQRFPNRLRNLLLVIASVKTALALVLLMCGFRFYAQLLIIAAILPPALITFNFFIMEKIFRSAKKDSLFAEDYQTFENDSDVSSHNKQEHTF